MKNETANIIVDLYEIRTSALPLSQARQIEKIENVFQYNFLSVIIANLCDKYKIENEDIKEIIRERGQAQQLAPIDNQN